MSGRTEAGKDAVDGISDAIEKVEEEVREDLEDAIRSLDRYEPQMSEPGPQDHGEPEMAPSSNGDYLDRGEVLEALRRSR